MVRTITKSKELSEKHLLIVAQSSDFYSVIEELLEEHFRVVTKNTYGVMESIVRKLIAEELCAENDLTFIVKRDSDHVKCVIDLQK